MLRAIGASKATKRRWFVLDMDRLSWWHPDDLQTKASPAGTVEIKDVLEIHSYGHGEDLYKLTPHLFEIVTTARTHAFGVETEEAKRKYTLTFLYACEFIKYYSYPLL